MNMHTFDESDFRTLFGFSHETYNEYSGICSRIRESINASTQKKATRKQSKKSTTFKNSLIGPIPRKKLSCREGLLFRNKSFREDIIETERLNRIRELHKENKILRNKSKGAVAVQRRISNLSQQMSLAMTMRSESEDDIIEDRQPVFGGEFLLPMNSIFRDLDEITEINKIEETNYRVLIKKHKKVYDSYSDEEVSDEINEAYYVEPFSKLRLGYDLLLFILVFYSMFSVPYELAFYFMQPGIKGFSFYLNVLIDLVFIFDIILSFFTAYYDFEEKLVKFYSLMALHYMQTWFIVDFLSGIPVNTILDIVILNFPNSKYSISKRSFFQSNVNAMYSILKLLRLIKAVKVFSMNSFIDKITSSVKQTVFIAKTIRLLTTLLIFAMLMHLFACLVIFFGYNSYPNWISNLELEPKDSKNVYIASLYFICTTVLSIGYGDILTYNLTERLMNGFLLLVGLLLYTWTLSSLTSYLISNDKIIVEYRNKCDILDDIKHCYDIPNELYAKIQRHLLYKLNTQKMDVNDIYNSLPMGLRNNLIIQMYKPIVENFVFFKSFHNTDFIIQVVLSFKPLLSLRGEQLLNDGDVLDEMLFVKNGKLILEFPLPLVVSDSISPQLNSAYSLNLHTQTMGNVTLCDSACNSKHAYAFQTPVNTLLGKAESRHYDLSDFDMKKQFQYRRVYGNEERKVMQIQQYVKLIEIRRNEHFGDVLMFLTKRSPLRVRVKTKIAELYLLKKTDAVSISQAFPKIWKQIIKKSLFNMKQINRLINKMLKFFFIHYEGTRNILGKTILPYNPTQTLGTVPQDKGMMNHRRLSKLARLTLGKTINRTQLLNGMKDANDIDTSNSELESIPDDGEEDDSDDSSGSSGEDKEIAKMKITRILETFEEDVLRQGMRKMQKQTIIFQHYDELLHMKDDDDNKITISGNNGMKYNHTKTKKSTSSSSESSIAHNNNNEDETDSSFSSSDNKTNSNIMNKSKSSFNRTNINKSGLTDSYKGTVLTYKDMKSKQHPTTILDELVDKNIISNLSIHPNNSSRLLDDSDKSEGYVYSEFHSNEGDLKDNLFMQRPILENYNPFTYYYNNNFNMNNYTPYNNGSYENLIQGCTNLCFYKNPSHSPHINIESHTNTLLTSLSHVSTVNTQKQKSTFKATLSSNSISNSNANNSKLTISTVYNSPNKPKCNFTFSKYNNANALNSNALSSNNKDGNVIEDPNSSFSSSSNDTHKKSNKKFLKPSILITPIKDAAIHSNKQLTQISEKKNSSKGTNYLSVMCYKPLSHKNSLLDDTNNSGSAESRNSQIKSNRITKVRSKKSKSNVNLVSCKGIDDLSSGGTRNTPSIMLNNSDSSSGQGKGEDDLEVEKIMNMTPSLAPDKKGNLLRQILTPAAFARKLELDGSVNEGYKKRFFGLSPNIRKRTVAKPGISKGSALDIIATNIQDNSTNLNEPKEFYSNLFSQFLGGQKEEHDMKERNNIRKISCKEPMNINEKEEGGDSVIDIQSKNLNVSNNIPSSNNLGVIRELKRNKTLII